MSNRAAGLGGFSGQPARYGLAPAHCEQCRQIAHRNLVGQNKLAVRHQFGSHVGFARAFWTAFVCGHLGDCGSIPNLLPGSAGIESRHA